MKTANLPKCWYSVVALIAIILPSNANAQDALDKMAIAFDGSHSRSEIKDKVDQALQLYRLPITNEYRSRVGSVLVSLSNSSDVDSTEMEILQCVIGAYTPGTGTTFPDMAGICAIAR